MNALLKSLMAPLLLLVLAWQLLSRIEVIAEAYQSLFVLTPYILMAFGLILAHQFNRSRTFAALLALGISYWAIQSFMQASLTLNLPFFAFSAVSVLLPLAVLILLIAPERGLWNRFGLPLAMTAPLCAFAAYLLFTLNPDFQHPMAAYFAVKPMAGYVLSLGASVLFGLVFMVGAALAIKRPYDIEMALLFVLLVVFFALAWLHRPFISTVMISAAIVSLVIDVIRSSYSMAYRDDLTGLLGRRALNEKMRGLGKKYAIAMLDVDHFKKFNDTHGHDVGDDVLKMVAAQIGKVEGGGIPYRYGGEEFAVIFPRKELEQCLPHLEAVRLGIEHYKISLRDKKNRPKDKQAGTQRRSKQSAPKQVSVTISIGLAERNAHAEEPETVIKAADKALYKSKQNGRNCVSH